MYFNASPEIVGKAKILRDNMTNAEKLLWEELKGKKICGLRFRRQHPIDIFIADFYCHEVRLVIEIDGEIHSERVDYDNGRSAEMGKFNITVIRFQNAEVEKNIEKVLTEIKRTVNQILQSPPWGI